MRMVGSFPRGLHIFALFGFAVAQPLFDLLSKNADFLVAHDLRPLDLLVLVCIVSLLFQAYWYWSRSLGVSFIAE